MDYYFDMDLKGAINVIKNIKDKKRVTYDFCLKNKFNYFDDDKEISAFFNIFKKILSSRVIKEYYERVESFKNFEFPLNDERIINYLWKNIIFTELDKDFSGITNREGFGIFINRSKGKSYFGLGYGLYIIFITHEVIGHFLKNLINSNSGLKGTPNQSFIKEADNFLYNCGDQKFDTLLFGEVVQNVTIGGNHFLLNIKNWDLSLDEFREGFLLNNVVKSPKTLITELKKIQKYDFVKELFKNINYDNIKEDMNSQSIPARKNNRVIISNSEFVS